MLLEQVDPLEQNRLCTKKDPANEDQYATCKESLKKKEEKIDTHFHAFLPLEPSLVSIL